MRKFLTLFFTLLIVIPLAANADSDKAVLGFKLDSAGQQTSIGAPTLVGPAGTVSLTGNPYNSGFITNGTYTANGNAPAGYASSYWLCYGSVSTCVTPRALSIRGEVSPVYAP